MKAKNRTALTYLILQILLFALRKEVIAYVIPLLYLEYPLLWRCRVSLKFCFVPYPRYGFFKGVCINRHFIDT